MKSHEYYSKHNGVGVCHVCGSPTQFHNINVGYATTCSRKCAAILHRRNLKNNPEKFAEFRSKVSNNMTSFHSNLSDEQQHRRMVNVINAVRASIKSLSEQQRKVKYGWLNKLNTEERQQAIQRIIETGCHQWWKNAPSDVKEDVWVKRAATLRETWSEKGQEIIKRQLITNTNNRTGRCIDINLSEHAISILNELFNIDG